MSKLSLCSAKAQVEHVNSVTMKAAATDHAFKYNIALNYFELYV